MKKPAKLTWLALILLLAPIAAWVYVPKVRAQVYLAAFSVGPKSVRLWALDRSATLGKDAIPIVVLAFRDEDSDIWHRTDHVFLALELYRDAQQWKEEGWLIVEIEEFNPLIPSSWLLVRQRGDSFSRVVSPTMVATSELWPLRGVSGSVVFPARRFHTRAVISYFCGRSR